MSEEHRDHVRLRKPLEFEYWADGQPIRARIEDVSEGGVFVDTATPHDVGDELRFRLTLPGVDPISGKAVVRWRQPNVGMGIEFVGLSKEESEAIKFYVAAEFFRSFGDS